MSKEFTRFFTDKRMIMMTLLPAIMIYATYTLMGSLMGSVLAPDEDHTSQIFSVNTPSAISQLAQSAGLSIQNASAGDIENIKEMITNNEVDLLMVFPTDFDELVANFADRTGPPPNIDLFYIMTEPNSQEAYFIMTALLDMYKTSLVSLFNVESNDLATSENFAAMVISMMMPMLLMIFLFSGCMGLALESITGEKERGTLATLLVSPLKRRELAIGKILSLAVLSFISGSVTAIATIFALPNMIGSVGDDALNVAIYSIKDYILLALVILTTLLLMVTMISIVSAYAKTVKEAGQATTPLMILVMLVGVSGMIGGSQTETIYFLIPLYGSVQSMGGIFAMEYLDMNVLIACISTLAYACIGGFVLTKMFNSEKIMFSR